MKNVAMILLFVPFALAGGMFYGLASDRLTKGKEPWFTFLMVCGLAMTTAVMIFLTGVSIKFAVGTFVAAATAFLALRLLFGKSSAVEMMFTPHLLVILLLFLWPTLETAREKARNKRATNLTSSTFVPHIVIPPFLIPPLDNRRYILYLCAAITYAL